jgi:Fic family protein
MMLADVVFAKKWELDALRHVLRPGALDILEHAQRIDITFTSNAIEGNALTAGETVLILEKGITVSGKPLKDHLETVEHAKALAWVLDVAGRKDAPITEADLRNLHRLAVGQSTQGNAGRYADRPRSMDTGTSALDFPAPAKIPTLVADLLAWLDERQYEPATAFEAHLRLVRIHPFNDGNGRTARLLMNLILARSGFPPIAVRPEDRPAYLRALDTAQSGGGAEAFKDLLFHRLDKTLDIYLDAARQAQNTPLEATLQST